MATHDTSTAVIHEPAASVKFGEYEADVADLGALVVLCLAVLGGIYLWRRSSKPKPVTGKLNQEHEQIMQEIKSVASSLGNSIDKVRDQVVENGKTGEALKTRQEDICRDIHDIRTDIKELQKESTETRTLISKSNGNGKHVNR